MKFLIWMRQYLAKRQMHQYIIKENAKIFAGFNHPAVNASVNKNESQSFLKLVVVIPIFKKG